MLEKFLYLSDLFDIYGALLTEKQQRCLQMSLYEDFSLSEIAGELGISRQAVYDNLHRSEKIMMEYEEKLKLLQLKAYRNKQVSSIKEDLLRLNEVNVDEMKAILIKSIDELLK